MRKGDLVVPWRDCRVRDVIDTSRFHDARFREWRTDQPAIIVHPAIIVLSTQNVEGQNLKVQILLDGELWWIAADIVRPLGHSDEAW